MSIFGSYYESIKILEDIINEVNQHCDMSPVYSERANHQISILNLAISRLTSVLDRDRLEFEKTQPISNEIN